MFQNDRALPERYREIVSTAVIEVNCADSYRFMGKGPRAKSKAGPGCRLPTLVQCTRLKHTLGGRLH